MDKAEISPKKRAFRTPACCTLALEATLFDFHLLYLTMPFTNVYTGCATGGSLGFSLFAKIRSLIS